jgi:hypothetical protein
MVMLVVELGAGAGIPVMCAIARSVSDAMP